MTFALSSVSIIFSFELPKKKKKVNLIIYIKYILCIKEMYPYPHMRLGKKKKNAIQN
jgi:hypothetical protein